MEDSKTLFCSSKFPWRVERISSNFVDSFARALRNFRQPCHRLSFVPSYMEIRLLVNKFLERANMRRRAIKLYSFIQYSQVG